MKRIEATFKSLSRKGQTGFITFLMAGDPDFDTSLSLIKSLPSSGVDLIEIGMPFTDPMADGPAIQKAGQRALTNDMTLEKVLELVRLFRLENTTTPIILMGYYNPIFSMGVDIFLKMAKTVGVDGLIIVDLPPEEDQELCIPAKNSGIDFIRLATPTTDQKRLKTVLKNASGFIYYVSVNGITGAKSSDPETLKIEITEIKKQTSLPVCVGFGIKTDTDAKRISSFSDGIVVGSAIIDLIERKETLAKVQDFIRNIASAIHIRQ